jgi:uncharacterized HAD superfamily protein
MKIAVDIDGVLSQTFKKYGEELAKRGFDVSGGPADEFVDWETSMLFPHVSQDDSWSMYVSNWEYMRSSYEVFSGAAVILHLLDHELAAVTNREVFSDEDVCSVTRDWLSDNGFPDMPIYHVADKASFCKNNGFDLLIEDSPRNAFPVAEAGIPVLLFDHVYNRHVSHSLVTRFTHWLEVPVLLDRILN